MQLIKIARQWRLRWRIWWIQRRYKDRWQLSAGLLAELLALMDMVLLSHYDTFTAGSVRVVTGFRDPVHVIQTLDQMISIINLRNVPEHEKYVTDIMLLPVFHRLQKTLDEFMIDPRGGVIDPITFVIALQRRVELLVAALARNETDEVFREYYPRKLTPVCADIFSILEGLLKVALLV